MPVSGPRILVVGAGSIGSRHARNLAALGAEIFVTDAVPGRAAAMGLSTVGLDEADFGSYDGVVIASPTVAHLEQTIRAVDAGARVLVEKPLSISTDGLDELVAADDRRVMVGYNLRFHEPVRRVVALVQGGAVGRIHTVRLWFGSWLPGWRPGTDYRRSYSARSELGGGILLDATHELDLVVWLCGQRGYSVAGAVVDRLGGLEIDVEDTVHAILRHEAGVVIDVSLDYLSRRYRRGMEIVGDQGTVRFDWARNILEVEDDADLRADVDETPVSRSYELEAEHFLAFVNGDVPASVDAATGAASVRLAAEIRAGGTT